ncbi:hypothetical protein FJY84_02545 [Candidatus Bathyarchaeota archaeon]|nr:hypothetical protein [Candidatus Bathyarchaeota archaeon]
MSTEGRRRPRRWSNRRPLNVGKKCGDCGLFSKTFYCQKHRKIFSAEKESCESWRPRRGIWGKRARKWP